MVYGRTAVFEDVYQTRHCNISRPASATATPNMTGLARALPARCSGNRSTSNSPRRCSITGRNITRRGASTASSAISPTCSQFPANFVFTNGGPFDSRIPRAAPGSAPFVFDEFRQFRQRHAWSISRPISPGGARADGRTAGQIAAQRPGREDASPLLQLGRLGPAGPAARDARGPDLNAVTRFNETNA